MMSEQIWHIRRARAEDASRIAEIWMRALRFYEKNGFCGERIGKAYRIFEKYIQIPFPTSCVCPSIVMTASTGVSIS